MGLPASLNMVEMVWARLWKNKYGTVDHAELIRHFGRQQKGVVHGNRSRMSRMSSSKKYKKLKAMVKIYNCRMYAVIIHCNASLSSIFLYWRQCLSSVTPTMLDMCLLTYSSTHCNKFAQGR